MCYVAKKTVFFRLSMPARKYSTDDDKPVCLPTRMPKIMIDYLHLVVRLRRPGYLYASLQELQADIVERFLTAGPPGQGYGWRTPRVAERSIEPTAYRQVNFLLSRVRAASIDQDCTRSGVSRATWLYTATFHYVQNVAPPHAIGLAP